MANNPKAKSETNNSPVSERVLLAVLLLTFAVCAGLLAFNLKEGIVPDEKAHFIFAKYYAGTWGIPRTRPKPMRRAGTSRTTPSFTIGSPDGSSTSRSF